MQAQDIYLSVATALHDLDSSNRRWTWTYASGQLMPSLQTIINDASILLVSLEPRATSSIETFSLSSGVKQSLPTDYRSLLDITRNMGSDGATPGNAVMKVSSRKEMDALLQDTFYGDSPGSTSIDNYFYDPLQEGQSVFWVYPAVSTTTLVYVEAIVSKNPTDVTSQTTTINIADRYKNSLVNIMLYMIYRSEGDDKNIGLANHYISVVAQELGAEGQVEKLYLPTPGG